MGHHKCLTFSVILSLAHIVFCDVWEFGDKNTPESAFVGYIDGSVGFLERTKQIPVRVPPCYVITYVGVKIDNIVSNPTVFFSPQTSLVTISYKLWQNSHSYYEIVSKAVRIQGCESKASRRSKFSKPDSD